jgi:hypothetical protein
MLRLIFESALTVVCSAGLALADDHHARPAVATPAFETLKSLTGEWVELGPDGKPTDRVVSVFKPTAAGSAVHETIFPGTDHEMVTVYHLDGKDLVLTHYCALGNQPRMRLDPASTAKELKFTFAGGSNIDPRKDMHMHEGSLKVLEGGVFEWRWVGYQDGKAADGHTVVMKLVRRKK